ncbi:MAG: hypothetical protein A4E45_00313 [Methanosaeta sp. PtaB.Bin039]|nr:MAG: hypothetical protein A4E45_00313 [Methanosaeta sp. PtaB.Bin039]OPY44745.1 MAG: hypothetical protein A4E47_01327 [Methanosaeta sp. PtaU1.Bin028]HOT07180.1 hypothetical protein [Methanotrichaceae archaeon]HQF16901.1 hypothetical protein [Methanotrichaceae archaeon]HQI91468.1 hypothetical protein [Methanotrichaceae archaeon]
MVGLAENAQDRSRSWRFLPQGEHDCGAVDEREARMLMHQIMAEIRRSNAPAWVAEELEKKLDCHVCCLSLQSRFPVTSH